MRFRLDTSFHSKGYTNKKYFIAEHGTVKVVIYARGKVCVFWSQIICVCIK